MSDDESMMMMDSVPLVDDSQTHTSREGEKNNSNRTDVNGSKKRRHDDSNLSSYSHPLAAAVTTTTTITHHPNIHMTTIHTTLQHLLDRAVEPNFEELARIYPAFKRSWDDVRKAQHARGPNTSFSSCITQSFTVNLTKALLLQVFHVELTHQHMDHLCPPVPNRFFYVKWIYEELMELGSGPYQKSPLVGLDIGTGSSCIYPLLACRSINLVSSASFHPDGGNTTTGHDQSSAERSMPTVTMYATEIDKQAYELANSNLQSNPLLADSINVLLVQPSFKQQQESQRLLSQAASNRVHILHGSSIDDSKIGNSYRVIQSAAVLDRQEAMRPAVGGPLQRALDAITTSEQQWSTSPLSRQLDFVMTNPPFYDSTPSESSFASLSSSSEPSIIDQPLEGNGRTRTTMTLSEGTYPGGEIGFVLDMFCDWLTLCAGAKQVTTLSHESHQHPSQGAPLTTLLPVPPQWCSAMIGKKKSFQYLRKILIQILGYGNVKATEYGPGQYTRWFLAWRTCWKVPSTFMPSTEPLSRIITSIRSPETVVARHPKDSFVIHINLSDDEENESNNDTCKVGIDGSDIDMDMEDGESSGNMADADPSMSILSTIFSRIQSYCESNVGGWELTSSIKHCHTQHVIPRRTAAIVTITERQRKPIEQYVDEHDDDLLRHKMGEDTMAADGNHEPIIPCELLNLLRQYSVWERPPQEDWLPDEGHFVVDVHLSVDGTVPNRPSVPAQIIRPSDVPLKDCDICVNVSLTCYRHSSRGAKAVEKIRNTIEGEICRTNRKWRKIRQRRQQRQQQQRLRGLQE